MDFEFEIVDELSQGEQTNTHEVSIKSESGNQSEERSGNALLDELEAKWEEFLTNVDNQTASMIKLLETTKARLIDKNKQAYTRLFNDISRASSTSSMSVYKEKCRTKISTIRFRMGNYDSDKLKELLDNQNQVLPKKSNEIAKWPSNDNSKWPSKSNQTSMWPSNDEGPNIKRQRADLPKETEWSTMPVSFDVSSLAAPFIAGPDKIDQLGEPFGKELTGFNIVDMAGTDKILKANLFKSFGEFQTPMGVELMKDEVIICNLNNNQVQFCDLDGGINLSITKVEWKNLNRPANATVLLDGRILISDDSGVNIYNGEGDFTRKLTLPESGHIYGIIPVRENNGMLGVFVQTVSKAYKVYFFNRDLETFVRDVTIKLPKEPSPMIRFTECLGNTIYLSDMSYDHNVIWIVDLDGNVRSVAGVGGKGNQKGQFVQAAGVTADNCGNFLAICSKTARIMAFTKTGEFMCEVQFPDGVVDRPSDLSLNDDGLLAITSLKGKVHLMKLERGDMSQDWPTRTKFDFNMSRGNSRSGSRSGGVNKRAFRGRPFRGGRGRGERGRHVEH